MKKNVAVMLAGGIGTRMETSLPKQFLKVNGRTMLEYSVQCFQDHPLIHEIAIVADRSFHLQIDQMKQHHQWNKVSRILQGGKERYQSGLAAIEAYCSEPEMNILFHDAARPLVSARIIDDVISALAHHDAVTPAIALSDTLLQLDATGKAVTGIPDRSRFGRAQTPQGFNYLTIRRAYEKALQDPNFKTTDDCGVVAAYLPSIPIFVVMGDPKNMKVTYPEDLLLFGNILTEQEEA